MGLLYQCAVGTDESEIMNVCMCVHMYVRTPCSDRFWGPTGILSNGAAGGHETHISVLTFFKVKNMHSHTFSAP